MALPSSLGPLADKLPEAYFPGLAQADEWDLLLSGLELRYPGRILRELPSRSDSARRPYHEDLPGNVSYLRIYGFEQAMVSEWLTDHWLVLDCRFLNGHEDPSWKKFWSQLGATELIRSRPGAPSERILLSVTSVTRNPELPAPIVLVNRQTRGPFEAALAALQAKGSIIVLGETTAGETGVAFAALNADPEVWVVEADLRPSENVLLLGRGVTPIIRVPTAPEIDFQAYAFVEKGVSARQLLTTSLPNLLPEADISDGTEEAAQPYQDTLLQRAVEILIARQLLNGVNLAD